MFIDLGDLSKGMGMIFMREFMETAEKMSCGEGRLLCRKGDATHYFFTLIQGELRLAIGAISNTFIRCAMRGIFSVGPVLSVETFTAQRQSVPSPPRYSGSIVTTGYRR